MAEGWQTREANFGQEIEFVYPAQTKPVSVTDDRCQLNCAHCGGHYLKHMLPLSAISDEGAELGTSCLISGGCGLDGKVPVAGSLPRLAALKQNRRYNLHTGLVDKDEAERIAQIADVVSFDFVGDDATIREVFGLDRTVRDYADCYRSLRERCRVMPHICIGLHGGRIKGEYRVLELLAELGAEGLTMIIFSPTRGTAFADRKPPELVATVEFMLTARLKFPDLSLKLGCMRPGGLYRQNIDEWALRLGINAIVNPAPHVARLAEQLGLTITSKQECCAL